MQNTPLTTYLSPVSEMVLDLQRFITEPRQNRASWHFLVGEYDLLIRGLRFAVEAGDDSSLDLAKTLSSHSELNAAISTYYAALHVTIDASRLARHVRGLIATAALAAGLKSGVSESRLLALAGEVFEAFSVRQVPGGQAIKVPDADSTSDIFNTCERIFIRLAKQGYLSTTARYWTLFWLDYHGLLEGNSTPNVPIVGYYGTGNAYLTHLRFTLLDDGYEINELVEHPGTSIFPLSEEITIGMERAWRRSGRPPLLWELKGKRVAQDGDSFSGSAAVALDLLVTERVPYNTNFLVMAKLDEVDLDTFRPVGHEEEKLEEATKQGIKRCALSRNRNLQDDPLESSVPSHLAPPSDLTRFSNVVFAGDVAEAKTLMLSSDRSPEGQLQYLRRYRIQKWLPPKGIDHYALAENEKKESFFVRIRLFNGPKPPDVWRAIWDYDLRTMYRISSSAATEPSLLQLKDARIDYDIGAFVMVLNSTGGGYETLETILASRSQHEWLRFETLNIATRRADVWKALLRIANGVDILHLQHVIHGNVSAENVFLDGRNEQEILSSWRLGGFELSSYLANQQQLQKDRSRHSNWGVPPECAGRPPEPYTFEHDWYAFGMLAARVFLPLTNDPSAPPKVLNLSALRLLGKQGLSKGEIELVKNLIAPMRGDRLKSSQDIIASINLITDDLEAGDITVNAGSSLALFVNLDDDAIRNKLRDLGYSLPSELDWNKNNGDHRGLLRKALTEAVAGAVIHVEYNAKGNKYALEKNGLILRLTPYKKDASSPPSWEQAFIRGVEDSVRPMRGSKSRSLANENIKIFFNSEYTATRGSRSWRTYLPRVQKRDVLPNPLRDFINFLRCTNECELLLRSAEIFKYRGEVFEGEPGIDHLRIFPVPDERPLPAWCRPQGGLMEAIKNARGSKEPDQKILVHLTTNDALLIRDDKVNKPWQIDFIHPNDDFIEISRARKDGYIPPPKGGGYIRTTDHKGQIALVWRRKRAIDNLRMHGFLLKALVRPSDIVLEGKIDKLPFALDPEVHKVDEAKIAVLSDILGVRPIYALQGPPGTGKTTLVAYLIREILEEDPVAQILVTSQAHPPVNVLWHKVLHENIFDDYKHAKPIIVRLGLDSNTNESIEGTVQFETNRILREAYDNRLNKPIRTAVEQEWLGLLESLIKDDGNRRGDSARLAYSLHDLVKRSANITFCTTSDKELEDTAVQKISYDWSIVEEAGRAHGFDLALPMQAGHRWMLLGDQAQLAPYRHTTFIDAIEEYDDTVNALLAITEGGSGLLDRTWLERWLQWTDGEKKKFKEIMILWLKTFEWLHNRLKFAHGEERITTSVSLEASAGRLITQYRMHPDISDLISETFYKDKKIINGTKDENVLHGLSTPDAITNKAVIWVDIPWCAKGDVKGEDDGGGSAKYTNKEEAEVIVNFIKALASNPEPENPMSIAVLSPYLRQRDFVTEKLKDIIGQLPPWLTFREELKGKRATDESGARMVHTVDSFQGNEANIIVVSLVRNNDRPPDDEFNPLGFLKEKERLNVLLSRAEKLLVLVGSWEFFQYQLQRADVENAFAGEMKQLFLNLTKYFKQGRAILTDRDFHPVAPERWNFQ